MDDTITIGGESLRSRLFIGTGKYADGSILEQVIEEAEPGFVTVALRRVNFQDTSDPILSYIDESLTRLVPNTSGANTAEEAVRIARICREISGHGWVKLEIHPDPYHLMPDARETLKAAEQLVREGFTVLPYIHADPVLAKQLEDCGCAAVMPLAAPIGSNKGLQAEEFIRLIIERARIPVVVDAGIGKPSDAARCIELGADAVLVNTAIATAENPVLMARAFQSAVRAGLLARNAGIAPARDLAVASSPLTGFLD